MLLLKPPLDLNILLGLYWWLNTREIVYIINLQSFLQLLGGFFCVEFSIEIYYHIFNWNSFISELVYDLLCVSYLDIDFGMWQKSPPTFPNKKYSTNLAYCISCYLNIDLISPFFFHHFRKAKKNNNIITRYCMPLKTLKIARNYSR